MTKLAHFVAIAALSTLTFGATAFAQNDTTETEQNGAATTTQNGPVATACKEDIAKYCATEEHGHGDVRACLEAQKDKVSKVCKEALDNTGPGHPWKKDNEDGNE